MIFLKYIGISIAILWVKLDTKRIELDCLRLRYETWCLGTHVARRERKRT